MLLSLGDHSQQAGHELDLPADVSSPNPARLPFSDHAHRLIALQRSPRCLKRKEAHPRFDESFDEAMVLLDEVVEVFDWPQFTFLWNCSCQLEFLQRFGIGCVESDSSGGNKSMEPEVISSSLFLQHNRNTSHLCN